MLTSIDWRLAVGVLRETGRKRDSMPGMAL